MYKKHFNYLFVPMPTIHKCPKFGTQYTNNICLIQFYLNYLPILHKSYYVQCQTHNIC